MSFDPTSRRRLRHFSRQPSRLQKKEQIGVKEVVAAGDPGAAGHELFQIVIGQEAKPLIFGSSQLSLRIRSSEVDDVINMGLPGQPLKHSGRAHALLQRGHGFKSCRVLGFFLFSILSSKDASLLLSLMDVQHCGFPIN